MDGVCPDFLEHMESTIPTWHVTQDEPVIGYMDSLGVELLPFGIHRMAIVPADFSIEEMPSGCEPALPEPELLPGPELWGAEPLPFALAVPSEGMPEYDVECWATPTPPPELAARPSAQLPADPLPHVLVMNLRFFWETEVEDFGLALDGMLTLGKELDGRVLMLVWEELIALMSVSDGTFARDELVELSQCFASVLVLAVHEAPWAMPFGVGWRRIRSMGDVADAVIPLLRRLG